MKLEWGCAHFHAPFHSWCNWKFCVGKKRAYAAFLCTRALWRWGLWCLVRDGGHLEISGDMVTTRGRSEFIWNTRTEDKPNFKSEQQTRTGWTVSRTEDWSSTSGLRWSQCPPGSPLFSHSSCPQTAIQLSVCPCAYACVTPRPLCPISGSDPSVSGAAGTSCHLIIGSRSSQNAEGCCLWELMSLSLNSKVEVSGSAGFYFFKPLEPLKIKVFLIKRRNIKTVHECHRRTICRRT